MKQLTWVLGTCLAGMVLIGSRGLADVKLPAIFGDNMVLQQGIKVPVWGWAVPGEEVTVGVGGRVAATTADAQGRWKVRLDPLEAGGPYEMIVSGVKTIKLKNVMAGEVWVCSGQSNMQMSVAGSRDAQKEIAESDYPNIRLFSVPPVTAAEPQTDCKGSWTSCSPQTIPGFTAVGYFFGRELHRKLGVPIGLINTSWGGTAAEAWTSRPTLEADPELKVILKNWESIPGPDNPNRPANLYNAMIAPLVPYALAGAIWYQGESNAGRAYQYRRLFPTMIKNWRKAWGQEFPFLFVQLANFMATHPDPGESAWAELREAQLRTLALPKAGMAVIIDIGEANDIHPRNKQDVGARLAVAAQKIAYNQNVVYSGPTCKSMSIERGKIRLHFKNVGGGLEAKGGGSLQGFSIAGRDRKFVWAEATIEGNTVVVRNDKVYLPIAVRYAWADNPTCNLYNMEGLPASPFRTDDWPGVTIKNR